MYLSGNKIILETMHIGNIINVKQYLNKFEIKSFKKCFK